MKITINNTSPVEETKGLNQKLGKRSSNLEDNREASKSIHISSKELYKLIFPIT